MLAGLATATLPGIGDEGSIDKMAEPLGAAGNTFTVEVAVRTDGGLSAVYALKFTNTIWDCCEELKSVTVYLPLNIWTY